MEITKKFESGDMISIQEYIDTANYGTSIAYLRAIGWATKEGKIKHLMETFGISKEEAENQYNIWKTK
jgi:hypothetical protein